MSNYNGPIPGIYKLTNPANQVYVGYSMSLQRRRRSYVGSLPCSKCIKLYESFLAYGSQAHKFEIIYQFERGEVSRSELELFEQIVIQLMESQGIDLLNINKKKDKSDHAHHKKKVDRKVQRIKIRRKKTFAAVNVYSSNGQFFMDFPSITEASKKLNLKTSAIRHALSHGNTRGGYMFKRKYKIKNYKSGRSNKKRPVAQFDYKTNKIIHEFGSIAEAGIATGLSKGNLSSCCSGMALSCPRGKYYWKYKDELTDDELIELSDLNNETQR